MASTPSRDSNSKLDAALEAEIASALGGMSLEDMLDFAEPTTRQGATSSRDLKTGTVVTVHGGEVFIEFGPKSQGICPVTQFDEPPKPGERLDFIVERVEQADGMLILSREGAVAKANWEALQVGQVIEGRCTGTNKGGLEVEVASHGAFMPAGQVDIRHIEDLSVFVGEKMACEVIELDRRNNRIILSRRRVLEEERARTREKLLQSLQVGQEVPGVVTSIQKYGAFVDLGGIDGLVHISDLSYQRVADPREVVKEGDQITVAILKMEGEGDDLRIGLGLKQTMADPFQTTSQELAEGATVTGRVTKIMDFGAFVEIAPGVEGLVHISELAHERVNRVSDVVKTDEIVTVKVLSVDRERQRIALSLKAMVSADEAAGERKTDVGMAKLRAKFGGDLKGGLS